MTVVLGQNWEVSPILSAPGDWMPVAIATDSLCQPHVAFGLSGSGVLGYARREGDTWNFAYPDSGGAISSIELCLDSGDVPHLSYVVSRYPEPSELRYAYQNGDTWHVETVARNATLFSLVLARDGTPHMAFMDSSRVKYAHKAGDTWNILTVPAYQADTLRRLGGASLATDTSDRPGVAVAWCKYSGGSHDSLWLSFFEYDGTSWHRFEVDSVQARGSAVWDFWPVRVRSDPGTDLFHILYRDATYATGKGNNWHVEEANVSAGNVCCDFVLHRGRPHIACASTWDPVTYQWRWAGGWETEMVVNTGLLENPSIAVDRDARPHIAFFGWYDTLFYARRLFIGAEEPAPPLDRSQPRLLIYPNLASGDLQAQYGVPVKGRVRLTLYDVQGRVKITFADREMSPGYYRLAMGGPSRSLPAGVYYLSLTQLGNQVTKKVVLAE